ncbi:hypothetical protein WME97_17790 [Sorangium sp. So ce367]|uniref:hypothetical protein n=1 Tax=Sorangium sp. So ce367 TaxID=3133305 RepID=UPI003F600416
MKRTRLPARRALLAALSTLALGIPCCSGSDLAPSSEVEGLRVLAVTADKPYPARGTPVTFQMTYADALGDADGNPRNVEVTWIGGCVNPPVGIDAQIGCLGQWIGTYMAAMAPPRGGEGAGSGSGSSGNGGGGNGGSADGGGGNGGSANDGGGGNGGSANDGGGADGGGGNGGSADGNGGSANDGGGGANDGGGGNGGSANGGGSADGGGGNGGSADGGGGNGGQEEQTALFKRQELESELSGKPNAASFTWTLSGDILRREDAGTTAAGTKYSSAYVLFAVCAGKMRPTPALSAALTAVLTGADPSAALADVTGIPLECVDEDGKVLGPDSFVVGYTQVFVFQDSDQRANTNPPIDGFTLKLDDKEVALGESGLPVVEPCIQPETKAQGCGPAEPDADDCTTYDIDVIVPSDAADVDVEATALGGPPAHEAIWVDYYTDGGGFDGARRLVSDAVTGPGERHGTTWTPPSKPGRVSLWAVVHDTRGGSSVKQMEVEVREKE